MPVLFYSTQTLLLKLAASLICCSMETPSKNLEDIVLDYNYSIFMGGLLKKMANFGEENGVNQIVIRPSPISDGWDF